MTDELIEQLRERAFSSNDGMLRGPALQAADRIEALEARLAALQPHIEAQREDAARMALKAAEDMAKYQAIISGCQKRRTRVLGLKREAYFTEIADEAATTIRAIDPAQFRRPPDQPKENTDG